MAVVALIAVLLAACQMRRRILFCLDRARFFSEEEEMNLFRVGLNEEGLKATAGDPNAYGTKEQTASASVWFAQQARKYRDQAHWCNAVRGLYERASLRPWEPVPLEPPPPVEW
jgi:hypothetical protein